MKSVGLIAFLLVSLLTCKKNVAAEKNVLQSLYKTYKEGEISECKLDGKSVYTAGLNAYDAGFEIFDTTGKMIGSCRYAWGPPDAVCRQLKSCEVVYRCNKHITGQPFLDKYGLTR